MTKKQVRKRAAKILAWERIVADPNASQQEKRKAEDNILQLTKALMCLPDGCNILLDIDDIIQNEMSKSEEN